MENLINYKDCPIGEYIRIAMRKDEPVETLTNEELWVLYTKARDDAADGQSEGYLRMFEAELISREIITASQISIFEGEN
jgi:hypothetical protein